MILYTMTPQELIFPSESSGVYDYLSVEANGVPLLVGQSAAGEYEIIRTLSSDPQHYLDERYTPGAKILLPLQDK